MAELCVTCGKYYGTETENQCSWCRIGMTQETYDALLLARKQQREKCILNEINNTKRYQKFTSSNPHILPGRRGYITTKMAKLLLAHYYNPDDHMGTYHMIHLICPIILDYWNIDYSLAGGLARCYYYAPVPETLEQFETRFQLNMQNMHLSRR